MLYYRTASELTHLILLYPTIPGLPGVVPNTFKMAPRIQSRSVSNLLPYLTSSSTSSSSSIPSLSSSQSSRHFSVTAASQTKLRRQMFEWLATQGSGLKHHTPGETNYLKMADGSQSNRPFPNNMTFISESVLSEELRNEVYYRVKEQKKSPRAVSVELGIDMNRIAAVVRLVELERRQREKVIKKIPQCYPLSLLCFEFRHSPPTQMMRQ